MPLTCGPGPVACGSRLSEPGSKHFLAKGRFDLSLNLILEARQASALRSFVAAFVGRHALPPGARP
jgi:hypothetical protein